MVDSGGETDLLLRIRDGANGDASYTVEALLSDGSFFRGAMALDQAELQAADISHDLDAYSRLLSESLFNGWISHAYDSARAIARVQSGGRMRVRLWLDSATPALQAIKWERLGHYHNEQFVPVSVTEATPFSRYVSLGIAEPEQIAERPIRLLFVLSNPSDLGDSESTLAPLNVREEVASLLLALDDLLSQGQMHLTLLLGQSGAEALPQALVEQLEALRCTIVSEPSSLDRIGRMLPEAHVLHFLGHGQYNNRQKTTVLLLEKEDGSSDRVQAAELIGSLTSGVRMPHLVFLASCETARREGNHPYVGLAAQLVQAGVPAVVAMQETITISGARQLVADFYRQLLQHGVVDRALNVARSLLYNNGPSEPADWSTPVFTMRLRNGRLFSADPVLATMRAMASDPTFTFFDPQSGHYFPLPIEVVEFNDPIQLRRLDRLEPETTGVLDFQQAMHDLLDCHEPQHGAKATFVGVVGNFSSNKSTQLKKLVWDLLQRQLDPQFSGTRYLPLYVDLRDCQPQRSNVASPLEACVIQKLGDCWPDLQARRLDELPGQPLLRLFFYGIELLSADDNARVQELLLRLIRLYPQHQYVVASSEAAMDWEVFQAHSHLHLLAIQPLRRVKIRHFLENLQRVEALRDVVEGERAVMGEKLLSQIYHSQLFDLVATPWFMVQVLLRAVKDDYPTSRTNALQRLVEDAVSQLPAGDGLRSHADIVLHTLAWQMQQSQSCDIAVGEAFEIMAQIRSYRGYSLETLYDGLLKNDLLFASGEGIVSFAYEPFRAYCCAKSIAHSQNRQHILEEITSTLGSPAALRWWSDTLLLVGGLLAQAGDRNTLLWLLRRLVEGLDLLRGEQLFLVARCLMEVTAIGEVGEDEEVRLLEQHVVRALTWRTISRNEPVVRLRVLATQLLSRIGEPETIIHLASLVYDKVRTNLSEEKDYEFSSVRMAGAIGLQRIGQRQQIDSILETKFHPSLKPLFGAWKRESLSSLIHHYRHAENAGIQAIAALAVGDVAEQLWAAGLRKPGGRALTFLNERFMDAGTPQAVRWAVADALSMMDGRAVTDSVITPYVEQREKQEGEEEAWKMRDKCMAYLIGLVRPPDALPLDFLIDHCISGSNDSKLWLSAMQALEHLGGPRAVQVLGDIAAGEFGAAERFEDESERCMLQRAALSHLVEVGDRETISRLRQSKVIQNPALMPALYRAIRAVYWQGRQ